MRSIRRAWIGCALLLLALSSLVHAGPGSSEMRFFFDGWSGPAIPVRVFVPDNAAPDMPIVIVMHGASRDAARYCDDWRATAAKAGFIVAVPHFSRKAFPRSARYNLGNVFDPATKQRRPAAAWTFAAIEPLFDELVDQLGGRQTHYTLFGHSAGAQFVHRFLYFVPDARAKRAIVANAGWYTMPDFGVEYPYGLDGSGLDESVLPGYFARDLVILLGDADTQRDDDDLRKTPEAELQGRHRYDRGHTFHRVGRARAAAIDARFNWRLVEVPGAGHSNADMTPAAASLVD
ncbi:MAG: hypothetical protein P8Y01_15760 [Woeseiaceae bacterium]|jgi:hypothetical protein